MKTIDAEDFVRIALNKGFELGDIQDFILMSDFQNLLSVEKNLKSLAKKVAENE